MSSAYIQDTSWLSKRAIVFVAIVALHILVIWAFASGLASNGVRYVATIIQTNIIEQQKPKDLPPPPPPVELKERPPVQVVAPDINISVPADAPPPPIQVITTQPIAAPPPPRPAPAPTPLQVATRPDVTSYYPDSSRRNGEEGRAIVNVCVNTSGKIDNVEVLSSSGFPRLDEAAIAVGRAFRFKGPAMAEGKPVPRCVTVPVKFELHAGN